ncbi:MAG: hypothetical protein PHF46_01985 [Candidatus Gracilibacteria bacterium]|nr:hypothetical protein [Candidatus Gracilibacteria bacterium]MDD3120154.1 hypothetical protein [Candidatus Gracilibacteria bacterium]MDD4529949.1 hypothetical protein [Candidatus Gracilibacteria bacterium]
MENTKKARRLKHKINLWIDRLSFNFINLGAYKKISLIGVLISFISLFLNWFNLTNEKISGNSFSLNSGYVGFVIILFLFVCSFMLLSNNSKEKIKTKMSIFFSDYAIITFSGIVIFFLTIVIFNSLRGMIKFTQGIEIGNAIIFEIIGSIFMIAGGIFSYKENKKEILNRLYIENNKSMEDFEEYKDILNKTSDKNMKLPI